MRGSVVKKGTCWYVKIELDPDPETGARRQKWHSGYTTKREAERARIDLLSKLDRGEYIPPSQQTVRDFFTEWLATIEPTVRPSTFDSYRRNVRLHVIAHLGDLRLTHVDAGSLNGLYALLLRSGHRPSSRKGKGYSRELLQRGQALRAAGFSWQGTVDQLRTELLEAERLPKNTLVSLIKRAAADPPARPVGTGLHPRTVGYVHTIVHRAMRDAVRWVGCPGIRQRLPIPRALANKAATSRLGTR
jgi:hypothetical protein